MSKYNLIDIYEQYQIGSGWTRDFDYDGMLNTGLGTSIDTPIEVLKKIFEDFTDVNYHREAEHLHYAIEAIEIGDMMEAQGKISDFHAEIKKTQGDQGMDIEPTLGKFMDARMEEDKDKEPRDGVKSAAAKLGMKPKHVKEVSSREGSRIEGLLSIPLKVKFLEAFQDLYFDLVEEDPFMAEDVVDHLGIEMLKHLDAIQAQGDSLAGLDQQEFTAIDEEEKVSLEDIVKSTKVDGNMEDLEKAVMAKAKKSGLDVTDKDVEDAVERHADMALGLMEELAPTGIAISQKQLDDLKKLGAIAGLEVYVQDKDGSNVRKVDYTLTNTNFKKDPDDIDFVNEDLKNHFGRFMKDYQ